MLVTGLLARSILPTISAACPADLSEPLPAHAAGAAAFTTARRPAINTELSFETLLFTIEFIVFLLFLILLLVRRHFSPCRRNLWIAPELLDDDLAGHHRM